MERFLIFGEGGWIAGLLADLMRSQGRDVHTTRARMEDMHQIQDALDQIKPTRVINCAGKTGRPNVDWCEDNRAATVRSNVIGTLMLADLCEQRGIHCTILATGCLFTSQYTPDKKHLTSTPFTEDSKANFSGSFYSFTKAMVEEIARNTYPDCLVLRLRMPVSDDLHSRSFVTKITKYAKVVDVPNSHSILHELLPLVALMSEQKETGVYNFTNPGAISHNEVLTLYRDIIDPTYKWQNFTLEEQAKVIKADRSNCELDGTKLMDLVKHYQGQGHSVNVTPIHEAYQQMFTRMRENMQQVEGASAEA
ncbi:hypothetical protein AMS68_000859 [Peltaster fructicola]|uniref:RmlD-like substrate binding domain-containing protein n=1 Tax=Peltaster fructicola TaxID=286661 RepID=A0A6H0XKS3_9PEZI|nr:hypothetical protein AMS68_000859 [Peltaster fructicola]